MEEDCNCEKSAADVSLLLSCECEKFHWDELEFFEDECRTLTFPGQAAAVCYVDATPPPQASRPRQYTSVYCLPFV
jgi:hypothetical protein